MTSLRRITFWVLLAVAAISAAHVPVYADDAQVRIVAAACHCPDGCPPDKNACQEQSSCAAICATGTMAADIGFVISMSFGGSVVPGFLAVTYDPIHHPPPLQPPTL